MDPEEARSLIEECRQKHTVRFVLMLVDIYYKFKFDIANWELLWELFARTLQNLIIISLLRKSATILIGFNFFFDIIINSIILNNPFRLL